MAPYLITFFISTALFEIGGYAEKVRHGRVLSVAVCLLALVPLCILAGARDISIGTDTSGYGLFMYQQGLYANNFSAYLDALNGSYWDIAPLYALISYAAIKLFGSQFAYFFVIELAVAVPVLIVARKTCRKHFGLPMLLWMLTLYIPSLNMMRQSIAIGLVALSVLDVMDGRRYRAIIFEALAALTHTSAIVGIVFWLLWHRFFQRHAAACDWPDRKCSQPLMLLSAVAGLVCVAFFREIASLFTGLDGIGRLLAYATHEGDEYGTSEALFFVALSIGSILMICEVDVKRRPMGVFLCYLVILSLPLFVLSGLDNTISRMTAYCTVFAIPHVGITLSYPVANRIPLGLVIVVMSCAFRFLVCFVLQGFNAAVPYTSILLGIA